MVRPPCALCKLAPGVVQAVPWSLFNFWGALDIILGLKSHFELDRVSFRNSARHLDGNPIFEVSAVHVGAKTRLGTISHTSLIKLGAWPACTHSDRVESEILRFELLWVEPLRTVQVGPWDCASCPLVSFQLLGGT